MKVKMNLRSAKTKRTHVKEHNQLFLTLWYLGFLFCKGNLRGGFWWGAF